MKLKNLLLVGFGVIIFISSFGVNSQPTTTIFWILGIVLVYLGLHFENSEKKNK